MTPLEKEKLLLTIGERIRKTRLRRDKTTKEIAFHLKLTTQAYGNIERGRCDICVSRLIELSKLLGVSVIYFVPKELQNMVAV